MNFVTNLAQWAIQIKERDGKCMVCGDVEYLHAHHIKGKAEYPELRLDLSNGMTLCYKCHKRKHELNRPVRIRSSNPHKRTLIEHAECQADEIATLKVMVARLKAELSASKQANWRYTRKIEKLSMLLPHKDGWLADATGRKKTETH